jgi:hypothetical protein
MMGLSLLLAVVATYTLRNKTGGKPLASVFLALALAVSGSNDNNLVGEANAALTPDCPTVDTQCYMTHAAGGTVTTEKVYADIAVTNNTGVAQTVTALAGRNNGDVVGTPTATPPCTVGLVVQPGGTCYIYDNSTN